jgi:hypothetical protein
MFGHLYKISQQSHSSRPPPIMNFHHQNRSTEKQSDLACHAERSEESASGAAEILRCAQHDMAHLVRESSSSAVGTINWVACPPDKVPTAGRS